MLLSKAFSFGRENREKTSAKALCFAVYGKTVPKRSFFSAVRSSNLVETVAFGFNLLLQIFAFRSVSPLPK